MRRCISRLALGVAVAAVTLGTPVALQAQQRAKAPARIAAPNTQPADQEKDAQSVDPTTTASIPATGSNWRAECSTDGQTLDCRALQQVLIRDNRQTQLVAAVTIRVPAETKKPVMMVQMPLGILVSETVELAVDEGKPERFNIQTCNQQGCFVGSPLAETLLAAMRNGKQLRIVFQNANKQAVTVTIPLAGFALVYDKVKS